MEQVNMQYCAKCEVADDSDSDQSNNDEGQ